MDSLNLNNEYIKILISIIIGFVIGLQRELSNFYKNKTDLAGARTFALISLIGYLTIYLNFEPFYGIVFIIGIGYYLNNINTETRGITTEISLVATYLVGVMVNKNIEFAIFSSVLIVFLLNIKSTLKSYEQ